MCLDMTATMTGTDKETTKKGQHMVDFQTTETS